MLGRRSGRQVDRRTAVTLSEAKGQKRRLANSLLDFVRRLAGMPDYERHILHLRRCHPEQPIPSRRQYFEEYLKQRYEQGPTRCC